MLLINISKISYKNMNKMQFTTGAESQLALFPGAKKKKH